MTLLEVMIAIVIVAIVVVGLISGLFTMIRASDENEDLQRIEAALASFANSVKEMPYRPCGDLSQPATPAIYESEYKTGGGYSLRSWKPDPASSGMTEANLDVIAVEYWESAADPINYRPLGWQGACPGTDHGVQRLTLQVNFNGLSGTAQVVKRQPVEAEGTP